MKKGEARSSELRQRVKVNDNICLGWVFLVKDGAALEHESRQELFIPGLTNWSNAS